MSKKALLAIQFKASVITFVIEREGVSRATYNYICPLLDNKNNSCTYFQTLLFLRPNNREEKRGTLSGKKQEVYIMMKILKLIHGASVTSFSLKYAIDQALQDTIIES